MNLGLETPRVSHRSSAIFSNPEGRAFSHGSSPSAVATIRAIRFHPSGELYYPEQGELSLICRACTEGGNPVAAKTFHFIEEECTVYFLLVSLVRRN